MDAINHSVAGQKSKACRKCKVVKSLEDFCRHRRRPDGRHFICKQCCNDRFNQIRAGEREKRKEERARFYASEIAAGRSLVCTGCGKKKALLEFRRAIEKPRGVDTRCRECLREKIRRRVKLEPGANKQCTKCREIKPIGEFVCDWQRKDGRTSRCSDCLKDYHKTWRERRRNGEDTRPRILPLKRSFGLLQVTFDLMLDAQGHACAICRVPFANVKPNKKVNVDHDHKSGEVRGLLCSACNLGIGAFRDDPALFAAAVQYLRRYGKT